MSDETFDQDDMDRFVKREFSPFLEAFKRHVDDDNVFQQKVSDAITRVSTSIEVGTAVQQATLEQSKTALAAQQQLFSNKWVKITVAALIIGAISSPIVTALIFALQVVHPAIVTASTLR